VSNIEGRILHYYPESEPEPTPAGVTSGYVVLRRGDEMTAEVATAAMLHDGEGRWALDIDKDSWRRTEIVEDL
jgi:hypothetical protein